MKRKIVVVDNDPSQIELISKLVEPEGYEIIPAYDGITSISCIYQSLPDALIIDIDSPVLNGLSVCQLVKSDSEISYIPIILSTFKESEKNIIQAIQEGAWAYIIKPFKKDEVLELLKKLEKIKKAKVTPPLVQEHPLLRDYSRMQGEFLKYKILSFEKFTGFPNILCLRDDVKALLNKQHFCGLMYLDLSKYKELEEIYGWEFYDEIIKTVGERLKKLHGRVFRHDDLIAFNNSTGEGFIILLSPQREKKTLKLEYIEKMAKRITGNLEKSLYDKLPTKKIKILIGCSIIYDNPKVRIERLLWRGIINSISNIMAKKNEEILTGIELFKKIIKEQSIRILCQKIFELKTMKPVGYEFFARGPFKTILEEADELFNIAKIVNESNRLDKLCWTKIIEKSRNFIKSDFKTFFHLLSNPKIDFKIFEKTINEVDLKNAIAEIPINMLIYSPDVTKKIIKCLRERDLLIALDDFGLTEINKDIISSIEPNFMKLSFPLIKNIEENLIKQKIVMDTVKISKTLNCKVIAKGIENKREYEKLKKLGVDYGQGYWLSELEELK